MPTFEFICNTCGAEYDLSLSGASSTPKAGWCPLFCGSVPTRVYSAPNYVGPRAAKDKK